MWRSRTSKCASSLGCACLIAIGAITALGALGVGFSAGCGSRSEDSVAELTGATGAAYREAKGESVRKQVPLGAHYFLGDAAHSMNGSATIDLLGGPAQVVLRDNTSLRFTGSRDNLLIEVETGQIDLKGNARFRVNGGEIDLTGKGASAGMAEVRRTAGGQIMITLTNGDGKVVTRTQTIVLPLARPIEVPRNDAPPIDAGVPDAAPPADAAIDAEPVAAATAGATIEIVGRRAEIQAAGQTAWKPLPAGANPLAAGSAVRLGPATTARASAGGTALELASGAKIKLGDDLGFALDAGGARATATAPARVALPGGAVALRGSGAGAAGTVSAGATETRLDAGPRDTRVTILRGGSTLTGAPGAELEMNRGETALLTRSGAIRVVEANPSYFDFRSKAGEAFTIHDPSPPTSVQLLFDDKCPDGGIIELDRDPRFRTAKVSGGHDFANVLLTPGGAWSYRLRCTRNGAEGGPIAQGRISVVRDDGRRPLPKSQGVNDIDADGRNYRISYQSGIPNVVVHVRNPGGNHRLHLASSGREQTFDSATAAITVPGNQFHEGTYTYWIDRDGEKQDKVSTLIIDFDQTAPQVYIESPGNAEPWAGDLDVRGAVLPGWSAAVDEVAIPIDGKRRFSAKVGAPSGKALAIRLAHPQRGVHYYLRRSK